MISAAAGAARNARLDLTLGARGLVPAAALMGVAAVAGGLALDLAAGRAGWLIGPRDLAAGSSWLPQGMKLGAAVTLTVLLMTGLFREIFAASRERTRFVGRSAF